MYLLPFSCLWQAAPKRQAKGAAAAPLAAAGTERVDIGTVLAGGVDELVAKMGEAGTKDSWKARKVRVTSV